MGLIPLHIPLDLFLPEGLPRLRPAEEIAVGSVPVPEAPIHEKNGTVLREEHVRLSRQNLGMQPKPEARPMQMGTDQDLRPGVLPSYAGHNAATDIRTDYIDHFTPRYPASAARSRAQEAAGRRRERSRCGAS